MTLPTVTITSKQKYIIAGTLIVVAFIGGRYSSQKPDVHTVTQTADVKKVDDQKDTHTQTTITTVKTPDGTVKTVEQINQVADEDTKVDDTKQVKVDQTITSVKAKNNISALVSNDFSDGVLKPSYGVSFQRELIGPVTVGAFGLTSGVLGLSIGINF